MELDMSTEALHGENEERLPTSEVVRGVSSPNELTPVRNDTDSGNVPEEPVVPVMPEIIEGKSPVVKKPSAADCVGPVATRSSNRVRRPLMKCSYLNRLVEWLVVISREDYMIEGGGHP